MSSASLITLTTDFGRRDSYVAQMTGAILSVHPQARLVEVTHEVPPQDVPRAALLLDEVSPYFPAGTVHLTVVDPGVGSERRLLAVELENGQRYVAPDNGVLTRVLRRSSPVQIVTLANSAYWRSTVSATFHGRDILGPVAAHWSRGADAREFGPEPVEPLIELPQTTVERTPDGWRGEILYADRFGNLITNLGETELPFEKRAAAVVLAGSSRLRGIESCYSRTDPGELLALIGSSGRLELAVNQGSAAAALGLHPGAEVRVWFEEETA